MANKHMQRSSTSLIIREMANQNYSEIPPHTSQNGHHQKDYKTINAGEGVRKRNLLAFLIGMKIDTATMKDGMEIP